MDGEQSLVASRALAGEVRRAVRERGLVVWVDGEGKYSRFVDELQGESFPYPVVPFRGSYLELLLAMEPYANGPQPDHVLVHLAGLTKESVKETPVYELYKAGRVFEKSLSTLVREAAVGVARPEEVEAFLREPDLTLEKADAWLASLRDQPRDRLTLLLEALGVEDVVLRLLTGVGTLREHLPEGTEKLLGFLEKGIGLTAAWRRFLLGDADLSPESLVRLVAGWLMAVEFVHDLNEPPVMKELQALAGLGPVGKVSREVVARFREVDPDGYELLANELQEQLGEERTSHHADTLGSIDTFRFEEAATRAAALGALRQGDWAGADALAAARTPEQCFWVQRSPALQRTWEIVRLAARTGRELAATSGALARCASLDEAVERYADKLAPVDRQHRQFEQRSHALLASDLEDYDALLEVRRAVRRAYREWADATNRAFFDLCVKEGPLPGRSLRQRTVYQEVVQPLVEQGGKVALFMVDALRFEMAQALAEELKKDKYRASLGARLAELPTITSVGMNALAPVERDGRLRLVMKNGAPSGFATGEFTVSDPAGRVRAISQRSSKAPAEDIELEAFQDLSPVQLKRRLSKADLVVVRSRELDTAGEHGLHLGTFDQTMTLLKSALSLLPQAGVDRFVVTSDHGFLLQDATTQNVPFGVNKRVPERRHALLEQPSGMPDVLEV
ncbi:MAG: BREX-6 system phosphatase PglZ, partial [Myxococcota bacterium]